MGYNRLVSLIVLHDNVREGGGGRGGEGKEREDEKGG